MAHHSSGLRSFSLFFSRFAIFVVAFVAVVVVVNFRCRRKEEGTEREIESARKKLIKTDFA